MAYVRGEPVRCPEIRPDCRRAFGQWRATLTAPTPVLNKKKPSWIMLSVRSNLCIHSWSRSSLDRGVLWCVNWTWLIVIQYQRVATAYLRKQNNNDQLNEIMYHHRLVWFREVWACDNTDIDATSSLLYITQPGISPFSVCRPYIRPCLHKTYLLLSLRLQSLLKLCD